MASTTRTAKRSRSKKAAKSTPKNGASNKPASTIILTNEEKLGLENLMLRQKVVGQQMTQLQTQAVLLDQEDKKLSEQLVKAHGLGLEEAVNYQLHTPAEGPWALVLTPQEPAKGEGKPKRKTSKKA